ncbi:MAG: hypothetical protein MZW92_01985 [Comamonadaceae bacterium]|nr:hypothetical protein [Comamonadaceae bacterium]
MVTVTRAPTGTSMKYALSGPVQVDWLSQEKLVNTSLPPEVVEDRLDPHPTVTAALQALGTQVQ